MGNEIAAAGAVVWRPGGSGAVEVAVVHRLRYDDWTLPKGKLDPGENTRQAAHREVHEETGAKVALGRHLARTHYPLGKDRKVVDYFAARYLGGEFEPSDEVAELRWLPIPDAREQLTFDRDHEVLDRFAALPPALTTLMLVRHAKAGSRAHWEGVDELRPLSRSGRKQLPPVRELGRVCGADRVYSAPLVRCVETVHPIAEDIGAEVAEEELLAEKSYAGAEEATMRRVLEIAAGGGVPVVCSQGGVIPDLVSRIAAESGYDLERPVESKKASVWLLYFDNRTLTAAEYLRSP